MDTLGECLDEDAADETTRTNPAVNLPRGKNPGARRAHRTRAPRPATIKYSEGQLHATIAELLDWVLLPPAVWSTFPAGWGQLGRATAGRLKHCGLKAGMPDILVFCHGVTIGLELKSPHGTTTDIQDEMFGRLRNAGVRIYICRSIADVIAALNEEAVPFRYVPSERHHARP